MCTSPEAGQGGSASPSLTHDVVTSAQYLHCLDLREVPCRNLVFSLQLNVDFWQPADKLSLLVVLSKYTRHLLLQVADDVGVYLQRYMTVRMCYLEVRQKDKHDGILYVSQCTTGIYTEPWSSGQEEGKDPAGKDGG